MDDGLKHLCHQPAACSGQKNMITEKILKKVHYLPRFPYALIRQMDIHKLSIIQKAEKVQC